MLADRGVLAVPVSKWSMLKQRIITAIILAGIIIGSVLYLPTQVLGLVLATVIYIAAWEWALCVGFSTRYEKIAYASFILFSTIACLLLFERFSLLWIVFGGFLWWLMAIFLVLHYQRHANIKIPSTLLRAVIGIIILLPAWLSLVLLHAHGSGVSLLLFLFLLVWLADSVAYFAGRKFASRKLATNVSPAKSWAGVYAALLASFLLGVAYVFYIGMSFHKAIIFILLALLTVSFSILGDLIESMFKRIADIKDSGHILPGHGGVLDRIDSLTAAAPVFFVGLWLMEHTL